MKFFLMLFLGAILAVAIIQVVGLYGQRQSLAKELETLETEAQELSKDQRQLQADIEYYGLDRNLGKEFQSKFNYKSPEETMVILVPAKTEE